MQIPLFFRRAGTGTGCGVSGAVEVSGFGVCSGDAQILHFFRLNGVSRVVS